MKAKAKKQQRNSTAGTKKKRVPGRPFPKGKSGNPLGRPKKGTAFSDILREIGEKFEKKTRHGKLLYNQALAIKVWDLALKGVEWAGKLVYDRVDGKAIARAEISGRGGGPVTLKFVTDPQDVIPPKNPEVRG